MQIFNIKKKTMFINIILQILKIWKYVDMNI